MAKFLAADIAHVSCAAHTGKVVVAMVIDGGPANAQLRYTVRRDGYEERIDELVMDGLDDWEAARTMPLSAQEPDASVLALEADGHSATVDGQPRHLLSSLYGEPTNASATPRARFAPVATLVAPVHLVSAFDHLYLFRQGTAGVVAERFVLDGITNRLVPTLELRNRRSRQRHRALDGLTSVDDPGAFDSLATRDIAGNPFVEPALHLGFLGAVRDGHFAVTTTPTTTGGNRWHFATLDGQDLVMTSVAASPQGWFDLEDKRSAAIVQEVVRLDAPPVAKPSVTTYAVQREAVSERSTVLLKAESRLMTVVPTEAGIVAVDFALAADGTLSRVGGNNRTSARLRGVVSEVDLPATTVVASEPVATTVSRGGHVQSLGLAAEGGLEVGLDEGAGVAVGDEITLSSTVRGDGLHVVAPVRVGVLAGAPSASGNGAATLLLETGTLESLPAGERLRIVAPSGRSVVVSLADHCDLGAKELVVQGAIEDAAVGHVVQLHDEVQSATPNARLGAWADVVDPATLVQPGAVTGYRIVAGALRLRVPDHAIAEATGVEVSGSSGSLDGTYRVHTVGSTHVVVDAGWPRQRLGSEVSVRGPMTGLSILAGDGYVDIDVEVPTGACTLELWIRTTATTGSIAMVSDSWLLDAPSWRLEVLAGCVVVQTGEGTSIESGRWVADGGWHHVAVSFGVSETRLLVDGVAVGSSAATQWSERGGGSLHLGVGGGSMHRTWVGDLADVRLWEVARSDAEVAAARDRVLTGAEEGLTGYWPCQELVGDPEELADHVAARDTSRHPGRVMGNVHAGLARLATMLPSGTPINGHRNDDLVPVTAGITYSETFEFLVVGGSTADDVPFDVQLRGKDRRESGHWIDVQASGGVRVHPLDDGWMAVTTSFEIAIDSGITLLRTFGIDDLRVDSHDLDDPAVLLVRNHRITHARDTTTLVRGVGVDRDPVAALSLPGPSILDELAKLELGMVVHDSEVDRIEVALAAHDVDDVEARRAELAAQMGAAARTVSNAERLHRRELTDPLNRRGPFTIHVDDGTDRRLAAWEDQDTGGVKIKALTDDAPEWSSRATRDDWTLDQSSMVPGTPQTVELSCGPNATRHHLVVTSRGGRPVVELLGPGANDGSDDREWHFERKDRLHEVWRPGQVHTHFLGLDGAWPALEGVREDERDKVTRWRLEPATWDDASASGERRIDAAWRALQVAKGQVAAIGLQQTGLEQRDQLELDLQAATARRAATSQRLSTLRSQVLASPATTRWEPGDVVDERGLATRRAVLSSRTVGAVDLRTLPEGDIEVLGSDHRGGIARLRYDTVADSADTTFEEWTPPTQKACVLLDHDGVVSVRQDQIHLDAFTSGWTVEVWYFHAPLADGVLGLDETVRTPLVTCSGTSHLELQQSRSGLFVGIKFWTGFVHCGVDLRDLAAGWHHLAVRAAGTGVEATTEFFVDGRHLGALQTDDLPDDAPRRLDDPIRFLGNSVTRDRHRALQMAEVRVWDIALRDDEVAANALNGLTGLEPGLVAWYPLEDPATATNEAPARIGRHDATIDRGRIVPFTATRGHPGHPVVSLAGQQVQLPTADVGTSGGVDFWVRFGASQDRPNLSMVWKNDHRRPEDAPDVAIPGDCDWHHVAMSWGPSVATTVWIDGSETVASTPVTGGQQPAAPVVRGWMGDDDTQQPVDVAVAGLRLWDPAATASGLEWLARRRHRAPVEPGPHVVWMLAPDAPWDWGVPDLRTWDTRLPVAFADPVSCDQVVYDETGAMLQRATFMVGAGHVQFRTGQRIARLDLDWLGTTQTAPTILGYIEGAPPVPSENLTVDPAAYFGASSVEVVTQDEVARSWSRSEVTDVGVELAAYFGPKMEADAAVVKAKAEILAGGAVSGSYQSGWESVFTTRHGTSVVDRLDLVGSVEEDAHFPHLGRRFVPKNVGYAVVSSGRADVFVTRLAGSSRMVSYLVRPAMDVPFETNTITFMMNPAYVMNGSLDGATGSQPTSERHTPRLRELRRRHGWRYPASYFRVAEARELADRLAMDEGARRAHFQNFELDLVRLFSEIDDPFPSRESSGDIVQDVKDAADDVAAATRTVTMALLPDRHAKDAHDAWRARQESIRAAAAQRNIVNTYVWDADGGLRAESQQFATSVHQHFGHVMSGQLQLGFESQGAFTAIAGVGYELSFMETVQVTAGLSKEEEASRGFALDVDLSGVERIGVTDFRDRPLHPGEKVDRYRFRSFYLEGSTDNFEHFFAEVVDREWLASNDEEARALRQVTTARPSKPWRVLHRVTEVERPALMDADRGHARQGGLVDDGEPAAADVADALAVLTSSVQHMAARLEALEEGHRRRDDDVPDDASVIPTTGSPGDRSPADPPGSADPPRDDAAGTGPAADTPARPRKPGRGRARSTPPGKNTQPPGRR